MKKMLATDYLRGLSPSPLNDDGTNNKNFDRVASEVRGKLDLLSVADRDALAAQVTSLIGAKKSAGTGGANSPAQQGAGDTVTTTTPTPTLPAGATSGVVSKSVNIGPKVVK